MKPNPLSSLNHFTVPVAILALLGWRAAHSEDAWGNDTGRWHCIRRTLLVRPFLMNSTCSPAETVDDLIRGRAAPSGQSAPAALSEACEAGVRCARLAHPIDVSHV